jgi:hypothetical protein
MVEHVEPILDRVPALPARDKEAVAAGRWTNAEAWALRNALLFPVVALFVIAMVNALPQQIFSDSWYAILGGHEVVHHGLPGQDTLAIWTHGRHWVDQQWLGQLFFYGLYAAAGMKLVLFGHAAAVSAAFAAAIVFARRRGASVRSTCWIAVPTFVLMSWGSWNARAQSLALGLFVAVVWLVLTDARAPSRRVFLVFPLLLLWANIHGSAITGAIFVVLAGLTYAFERRRQPAREWLPRTAVLCIGPVACLFASPYATSLPDYYRHMLFNSAFRDFVMEWRPTAPDLQTSPFYLLAFVAVWLIGRRADRLSSLEKVLLVASALIGLQSLRGVVWFALVALMVMPVLLDGVLKPRAASRRFAPLNRALIASSLVGVVLTIAAVGAKPASWFERDYPQAALAAVEHANAASPDTLVFASTQYTDWLLLRVPELRGRIAFDTRFELLPRRRIEQLIDLKRQVEGSRAVVAPYGLFVLKQHDERLLIKGLLRSHEVRILHRGHGLVVLARPAARNERA